MLLPAYPNPFNANVQIPYRLFRAADVNIAIYDMVGQLVRELSVGVRDPGLYLGTSAAYWDGRSQQGVDVASGVFVSILIAGEARLSQKLMLLR